MQDWFRITCISAATATVPVPKLIPEMRRQGEVLEAGGLREEAAAYRSFVEDLHSLAMGIKDVNKTRKGKREVEFGSFDPRRLEVSVSL